MRLLVDVSTILGSLGQKPVGITRTEFNLAERLTAAPYNGLAVIFDGDGALMALNDADLALLLEETRKASSLDAGGLVMMAPRKAAAAQHANSANTQRSFKGRVIGLLGGAKRMSYRACVYIAKKILLWTPGSIRDDMREIFLHLLAIFDSLRKIIIKILLRPEKARADSPEVVKSRDVRAEIRARAREKVHIGADPTSRDVLFTAGHINGQVPHRALAELRHERDFRCVSLLYDVIRAEHPEFNPPGIDASVYVGNLLSQFQSSDRLLSISRWTAERSQALGERYDHPVPPTDILQLSPINLTPQEGLVEGRASRELSELLGGRPFCLVVGTVESRKNHALLVRLWESLAEEEDFDQVLVIVGRNGGWDDAASAILESPLLGESIHWVEQCPDEALAWLYSHCHLFLYPSFLEGWGLPVAEAAAFGCPLMVSTGGAVPEAAGAEAVLLDPNDLSAWRQAVLSASRKPRERHPQPTQPTWDDVAAEVYAKLSPANEEIGE